MTTRTSGLLTVATEYSYSEISVELKLLLKRGALLAVANWPAVAIQFAAETTFQVLLIVPIVGSAILVALLLGSDVANLLQGSRREIVVTIGSALSSEPVAFVAFVASFGIVLLGGSVFMFLVKGGTVDVLLAGHNIAGPIERLPLTFDTLRSGSAFTLQRFLSGCGRLFRRYLTLGLILMVTYAASAVAYLTFVVYGYRAAAERGFVLGWTVVAALATLGLVLWITIINLLYLLAQIVIAVENVGVADAFRGMVRFIRAEFRELGAVFLVVLGIVAAATLVSALAWSGVGLIAFIPLVGLAVFPLQILALIVRGLVFEYIGIAALGSYVTLYRRHSESHPQTAEPAGATPSGAWG